MGCFVVTEFLVTSVSRGPSAIAELLVHIAVWARASLFRRFTDTNVHITAVPLKRGKLATKYPQIYGYFLECTVYDLRHSEVDCIAVMHSPLHAVQWHVAPDAYVTTSIAARSYSDAVQF